MKYPGWRDKKFDLNLKINNKKEQKYHNKKVQIDGIWFQSKHEGERYTQLKLMQQAGLISGLALQYHFPIHVNGIFICDYVADFVYYGERGFRVVEDAKGVRTDVYKLKKKLFEAVYNQRILET
jgi:uncharacterized protein DUF1064